MFMGSAKGDTVVCGVVKEEVELFGLFILGKESVEVGDMEDVGGVGFWKGVSLCWFGDLGRREAGDERV